MLRRISSLALIVWALGFIWFAVALPLPAGTEKADVVVVPTGGEGRIDRGLAALRSGWAGRMLVSGVSLIGYLALRLIGTKQSLLLVGAFGGLVSSTATTLVYAREAGSRPAMLPIGGTTRRRGRRNGRVTMSKSGAIGACGLSQEKTTCTITAKTRM